MSGRLAIAVKLDFSLNPALMSVLFDRLQIAEKLDFSLSQALMSVLFDRLPPAVKRRFSANVNIGLMYLFY